MSDGVYVEVEKIEMRCRRLVIFSKGYTVKVARNGLEYRFVHMNRFTLTRYSLISII